MKKFTSLVLIIFLIISFNYAQEFNPPMKGDKAMLFGFSGLGFLGVLEYQGGFGYKMFMSNSLALRTGLMFNYNNDKIPESTGNGVDGYDRIMGYGAEVAFEIHKAGGKIDPYYGLGGSFFSTTTESAFPTPAGVTQVITKNAIGAGSGMNFGAFLLLGMEYYITDNLSLAGEYHFGFDYTSALTEKIDNGTTVVETEGGSSTGFGIASTGLLTLAIYR